MIGIKKASRNIQKSEINKRLYNSNDNLKEIKSMASDINNFSVMETNALEENNQGKLNQ